MWYYTVKGLINMENTLRAAALINRLVPLNPAQSCEEIIRLINSTDADIAVFPPLAFTGAGNNLVLNPCVISAQEKALEEVLKAAAGKDGCYILGVMKEGRAVSLLIYKGEIVKTIENTAELFKLNGSTVAVVPYCTDLLADVCTAAGTGADVVIIQSYRNAAAGRLSKTLELLKTLTENMGISAVFVNGGIGETSSPYVYRGFAAVFEAGKELEASAADRSSISLITDIDIDIIRPQKKHRLSCEACTGITTPPRSGFLRHVGTDPFLESESGAKYLKEVFYLQAKSLADRMENTGIKSLVLGISGGLDSTMALIAAVRAAEMLGLSRENILGVIMPGFGTSAKTLANAEKICKTLGIKIKTVDISEAVKSHLNDIGHRGKADTAYENAQARERTQILLDIANMHGALMVGTGDMSENALGFATFGGDHLASYNVNSCITKTMLKHILSLLAAEGEDYGLGEAIKSILATPISPELLPADEKGNITQKTEDILGPYILHDFFLYYFIRYNFPPKKILAYARLAFEEQFTADYIKEKLALFLDKFIKNQFKRSCAPDSAVITEVNLSNSGYYIPSDINPAFLLDDIE